MAPVAAETHDRDRAGDGDEILPPLTPEALDASVTGEVCFAAVEVVEG